MNTVEWTAVVGVIVAVLGTVLIPLWLQRRKDASDNDLADVVSWKGITEALQKERDSLRQQLDAIEERHRRQLKDIEADYDQRTNAMKKRITDLEDEVAALHRALRGDNPPSRRGSG